MSSIELHIVQSFPPSNLNRDDIGQPKSTDFGGVRRARISSQCQKRAIRLHPAFEKVTGVAPSDRTMMIARGIADRLVLAGKPADQSRKAASLFAETYSGGLHKSRKDETAVLLYFSANEYERVASYMIDKWDEVNALITPDMPAKKSETLAKSKKTKADKADISAIYDLIKDLVRETKERTSAPDIALFGRMLADRPETNIDAACQVAHAISTHKVGKADTDYYTAMDDVKQRMKDPGAGFLDVAYFNSACFYRYMRIDFAQLEKTLGDHDLAVKTVEGFMRAAEAAVPSGKQNSHAQFTRPSFMLAVLRPDGSDGWNLVNAFERPVRVTDNEETGLIGNSVRALEARFNHQREFYGDDAVTTIAVALPDGVIAKEQLGENLSGAIKNMNDWVKTITDGLSN